MNFHFSIIVPVFNRPNEIDELLESFVRQDFSDNYEILIIEDGSQIKSDVIVRKYTSLLNITYHFKENTGAGDSRNFGMKKASGNYYIILDSDVILPKNYLLEVKNALTKNYTDAFGGEDAAHASFTSLQKAINFSMTSLFTTGGIRGKKIASNKFQLRSFNLGISKAAFLKTKGFSNMKNGEDIDLTFRLWQNGFSTQQIKKAFVYHKRRTSFIQFFKQTYGFGTARPILNKKHPNSSQLTFWFPSLFIVGFAVGIILLLLSFPMLSYLYACYFLLIFFHSLLLNKSFNVAFLSIFTTITQFLGYGIGFLKSQFF
ncbi:glycosyltransferase [Polaribacter tangerinus]|uniref:glycosyltransferase n=1 Tax=Polaribacter tangerinus TaxID=1920034 RepID=UPI001E5DA769|nr:glycosyltransferase [Polaribacter tangerinus]